MHPLAPFDPVQDPDRRLRAYYAAAAARTDEELRRRVIGQPAVFRDAVDGFIRRRRVAATERARTVSE